MMTKSALFLVSIFFMGIVFFSASVPSASAEAPTQNPTICDKNSFLGFPYWYKYLEQAEENDPTSGTIVCRAKLKGIQDVWLVVAACIELLIRLSSMIAIGFIIYGGVSYIISQGSPDKTKKAQATAINAVIGLAISIVSAAIVSFIAGRF